MAKELNVVADIVNVLKEYADHSEEDIEAAARVGGKAAQEVLKGMGGYHDITGNYRGSFRTRKVENAIVIHSAAPDYRLTHLLEYGHALHGGGRARAFPHWKEAERVGIKAYEDELRRRLEE